MTYWKTEHFKALQQDWYRRLEAGGFQDVEELVGDEMLLRESSLPHRSNADHVRKYENCEEYYLMLSQRVQDAEFRSEIDRLILMRYSDGEKVKTICQELRERGTPRFRHTIRFTVRRYEAAWGLREYTPRQLGKKVG